MVVVKAKRTPGGLKLNLKKGALHTALGVAQSKDIPTKKLAINENDSALLKKRKQFAINAAKWKHGGQQS